VVFAFASAAPNERKATQETTQETTQEKILALLRAQPSLTRREMAGRIGISADGIKYHLDKLKAAGRISHAGPTKAGHWEVLK
jgi:ATP-dependent DNA helicase RecG